MPDIEVIHLDSVGKILSQLNKMNSKGMITKIAVVVKDNDGQFYTAWHDFELDSMVGMAEILKAQILYNAE